MIHENTFLDRANRWIKNSVTLKLLTVGVLILMLLVPSTMIKSIIRERENLSMSTINEVNAKWAEEQTISGPILTIPMVYEYQNKVKKEDSDQVEIVVYEQTEQFSLLPKDLNISGTVSPKKLRRGIYEIVVYESDLHVEGSFDLAIDIDESNLKEIQWDKASITIGISDLRGIKEGINFKLGKENYTVEPGSKNEVIRSGVSFQPEDIKDKLTMDYSFDLHLQGSQNLSFIPMGGVTQVSLTSDWSSPSFNGSFKPVIRDGSIIR
ncbi:MAG: inner membrane CreD family protein [Bacteroidota bacterium]